MARGIQEGDDAVIALDLIRTDGLRDAAGLTLGDIGLADSVQNGGLAVVDVAHNDNNGGTLDQIGGVILLLHKQALLDGDVDLMLDLGVELLGDQGGGVEINNVGDGVHLAHLHELGNDLGGALLQAGGQLADGDLIGDGDLQLRVAGLFQLDALQALELGLALALLELLALALAELVYTLIIFATGHPVAGWTTTMFVITVGFAGLFAVLTIVVKYLCLLLNLNFRKQKYLVESIEKLQK